MTDASDDVPVGTTRDRRMARLLVLADRHRRLVGGDRFAGPVVGAADMRLLWLFNDHQPRTLRQISESLGLEQSTVNRQVSAARDEGFLRRFNQDGAPAQLVEATPRGHDAFETALKAHLGAIESGLGALSDEDSDLLLSLFEKFIAAFGDATRDATEPARTQLGD